MLSAAAMMMAATTAMSTASNTTSRRILVHAVRCSRVERSPCTQAPYSARRSASNAASRLSTYDAARPDPRISHGVSSVVSADTATATGYRKWPVTPSDRPTPAMMNENSPICPRLSAACTDVRTP